MTAHPAIRLLVIEPSGLLWGSERALLDLLSAMDRKRFAITVVCPARSPICAELDARGIRWVGAPIQHLHRKGRLARARALLSLRSLIRRERPDVVHVNQAGMTRLTTVAARGKSPVVSHVRLFEDAELIRRLNETPAAPQGVVAISQAIRDVIGPVSGSRVALIHDPFDMRLFALQASRDRASVRRALGIDGDARIVVMVGRVCREKGQHLLLDAMTKLRTTGVVALMVGGTSPGDSDAAHYADQLDAFIATHGLRDRVKMTGARNDVASLIAASDLLVLASEREPFGRVLLEALSLDVPVVASRAGGAIEILGDDERGLGFAAGDSRELAERIDETFAESHRAVARTTQGREYVETVCAPAAHAAAMEAAFVQHARPVVV